MAETLIVDKTATRKEQYAMLLPQIDALTQGEPDVYANLANTVAAIKEAFGFFWVGVYLVKNGALVLGPFQGPIACTRIKYGSGVCGSSWAQKTPILVPDVAAFPGHIACSSLSKSEVVVPVLVGDKVVMVIDVDSNKLDDFTTDDVEGLTHVAELIAGWYA
jgi:GAF domain-containing protein